MASPVPSRVPRPGHPPPNYNPNFQRGDTLSDSMQNLQVSHPPGPPLTLPGSSVPQPAAYQSFPCSGPPSALTLGLPSAPPSSSFPSASPVIRPGPPLTGFPTVASSESVLPQATLSQSPESGRPSGSPFSQHPQFSARPSPGVFTSSPLMGGPTPPPPSSAQGPLSNGPPTGGTLPGGPPSSITNSQHPPIEPLSAIGFRAVLGQSVRPFPGSPPPGAPVGHSACMPPPSSLYGSQMGQMQLMQFVLQQYDNELSKELNDMINEIRRRRCSYLRLRFCKKGEPSGMLFFSHMVEDKSPGIHSYVEFLVHVYRQIQIKGT